MELTRCPWCSGDALYTAYHDEEWGVPCADDQTLFEALILDGAQAGLSWITILRRRDNYRAAFDGFDAQKIAAYTEADITRLMGDARIIRNRRKIESAIANARGYLAMMNSPVSFSRWLWNWVDGKPIINHYRTMPEIPASTELSTSIAKELKQRGFTFVGPTIVYAFMQAKGLVNDHLVDCFRHRECASLSLTSSL
jgi:DNA-3-methyladenine glycosylase I